MKRMVLTISEARVAQAWDKASELDSTGPYDYRLHVSTPEAPHTFYDDARMMVAIRMTEQSCSEQHIKEQMNWKPNSVSVKTLVKRFWASRNDG
jgi:hypothetical protein